MPTIDFTPSESKNDQDPTTEQEIGTFEIEPDFETMEQPEQVEPEDGEELLGDFEVSQAEMPLPGGGLTGGQTFLRQGSETVSLWEKAKNLFRDPEEEGAKAVQALVDAESLKIRPSEAYKYRDMIDRGVEISPQAAALRGDLTDRVKQSWDIGMKQNQIGEAGYQYIVTGDPRYLTQIENTPLPTKAETFISESRLEDATRSAAKLLPMVIDTGTESLSKGAKVGMGFGLIAALAGQAGPQVAVPEEVLTVPAATLAGFKIGATSGAFEASLRKEAGLALSEIINFEDEEGNRIDPNIAMATAYGIGAVNAGIEVAQLRLLINTVPGLNKIFSESTLAAAGSPVVKNRLLELAGKYAGTVAAETAQEIAQESTNIVFEELAKEVNNRAFDTDIPATDIETVLNRLEDTMIESAQGFAVISLPGTVAQAFTGRTASVADIDVPVEAELPAAEAVDERTEEQILSDIEGQETISDDALDALLDIDDEAQLDIEIDRTIEELGIVEEGVIEEAAEEEIGPRTQAFQDKVAQVVEEEEATAVNTLMDARAKAVGMTTDEYIEFHGLEIETLDQIDPAEIAQDDKAQVVFEDNRTIIRAFEAADVSSLVHELGHVFRRDLGGEDLATVETWAGVEDGNWTRDAEEKFARGWENYLATGEAPTSELKSVFERFKQWMSEIYNSIVGSSIDVEISPDVRDVFDRLLIPAEELTTLAQAREEVNLSDTLESVNSELAELQAKPTEQRTATDNRRIRSLTSRQGQLQERIEAGEAVGVPPRARPVRRQGPASTKVELKKALSNAKKAMRKGDHAGVAKERARMKEIIARATERRKRFASIRTIKNRIKKELRTAKVKKISGKPVGKFTAEVQTALDKLVFASKLSPEEAEAKIAENLDRYQNELPPDDVVVENHMLEMVAKLDTMQEPEQLQGLLDEIKALKDEGRLIKQLRDFNRSERNRARVETTIEELGGVPEGTNITGIADFVPDSLPERIRRALRTMGKSIVGWDDLMDILSFKTDTAPGQSFISRDNDLLQAKNEEKRGTRIAMDRVNNSYMEAFGLKNGLQVVRKAHEDNTTEFTLKKVPMQNPVDGSYVEMDLKFTKAELRKRVMELQDPTLADSFAEMGYTEDTTAFLVGNLNEADKQFIRAQQEFYQGYYNGINEVYSRLYGVNLPKNENYSPIMREGIARAEDAGMGEFLKEMSFRASAASAGALKTRVGSTKTISKQSDIQALERHITEMEHFKAWAARIRDINAVWKNPGVRAAVEINHGKDMLGFVDNFVSDIAQGSAKMGQKLKGLDALRINFTRAALAVNPDVMIKQMTSFVAYAEQMPAGAFVKNLIKFWANPIENTRTIYTSELMKARGQNIERDVAAAMKSTEHSAFNKSQSLVNMLMLNIQVGDQGAITIGGWAYYKYQRDQGLSHEAAIQKFEKFTEQTQQSADITEQSYWQRGGSLAKLVTMFASSPNQYLRKEIGAIRNLAAGRHGIGQTLKTLIIYHALLPMFFQFVSDRFTWDEDEQKRALIFGALNGWFIMGDGLDFILRKSLGMQPFNMELPVYSVFHDFIKATSIVDLFDLSAEEFFRAIRGVAGVAGAATGIPFKQFVDEAKGANDVLDGEYEKGLTELMGYSPYLAEKLSQD
jgi:hypothetical protein